LFESLFLPQKSFALPDLFAGNGSGFPALCAQITTRTSAGGWRLFANLARQFDTKHKLGQERSPTS
jgi:hypothetical protein